MWISPIGEESPLYITNRQTRIALVFGLQKLAGREAYQYLCPKFWQDYCDYQREKLLGGNDRPVRIHGRAKKIREVGSIQSPGEFRFVYSTILSSQLCQ